MADHSHQESEKVRQLAQQQRWNGATLPLTPAGIQRKELHDAIHQKKAAEMANFYSGVIPSQVPTIQRKLSSIFENDNQHHVLNQSSFDAKPVSNTMPPPDNGLIATDGPSQVGTDEIEGGEENQTELVSKEASPTVESPTEDPSSNTKESVESLPQSQPLPPTTSGSPPTPPPAPAPVTGLAVPRDNFAGRSTTSFGVGEVINLSFRSTSTAAALGGLKWSVASGGGAITGATNAGVGQYTCSRITSFCGFESQSADRRPGRNSRCHQNPYRDRPK